MAADDDISVSAPAPAPQPSAWGPEGRTAAVSITFDNLGEAMDLAAGSWPRDAPVGRHPSVVEVLPRILELLDAAGIRGTYFAEGWSADVYPDALRQLTERGHEIAYHGWRHEHWQDLKSPTTERDLIARGVATMRAHGIHLRGFRPPGGVLTPQTLEILRTHGFSYVSPAGRDAALLDGLVVLPFRWTAIDAYYFFDAFGPLRRAFGDGDATLPPDRLVAGVQRALDDVLATGGYLSLLFHPFLEAEPAHYDAMAEVVARVADHPDIWCAPAAVHAKWALAHPERLATDPHLDARSWR
jgi:peptidoglycan/xylan/chitin deacetylase (PgdA/CDA1 family)